MNDRSIGDKAEPHQVVQVVGERQRREKERRN